MGVFVGDIVDFRPSRSPVDIVLTCSCGCQTFELRRDGATVCAHCGGSGEWAWSPPDEGKIYLGGETFSLIDGATGFAQRRIQALVGSSDLQAVAVLRGGYATSWSHPDADLDAAAECLRRIADQWEADDGACED